MSSTEARIKPSPTKQSSVIANEIASVATLPRNDGLNDIMIFMQLNQPAPEFELPDLQGISHRLSDYRGRIVIVNFWSAECPHSERTDRYILSLLEQWNGEVVTLSIAANRNESVQMAEKAAKTRRIPRVLLDAEHTVADLYEALTTPHLFVVDREGILRYRGAADNITFRQRGATRFFLEEAVEALLQGRLPELNETPAYGCVIVREI
ncbi:MAG TPA: redoxin domain-containing protein [Anaerolineales bacterium]|nr:redoxin domain-containing protein [Anaerolineales bacterium]